MSNVNKRKRDQILLSVAYLPRPPATAPGPFCSPTDGPVRRRSSSMGGTSRHRPSARAGRSTARKQRRKSTSRFFSIFHTSFLCRLYRHVMGIVQLTQNDKGWAVPVARSKIVWWFCEAWAPSQVRDLAVTRSSITVAEAQTSGQCE